MIATDTSVLGDSSPPLSDHGAGFVARSVMERTMSRNLRRPCRLTEIANHYGHLQRPSMR
jgi:hypothetical protein